MAPAERAQPKRSDNRARAHSRRRPELQDGETFDIDNVSSSSDGESNSQVPPVPAMAQPNPAGSREGPRSRPAVAQLDPARSQEGSRGGGAHDINFFFRRGVKNDKESSTVCKTCEWVQSYH
jgi:hypothetical protein